LQGIFSAGESSALTADPVIDAMEDAVSNLQPQTRYLVQGGKKFMDWYCVSTISCITCNKFDLKLPTNWISNIVNKEYH